MPYTEQAIRWKQTRTTQKHDKDGPLGAKAKKSHPVELSAVERPSSQVCQVIMGHGDSVNGM